MTSPPISRPQRRRGRYILEPVQVRFAGAIGTAEAMEHQQRARHGGDVAAHSCSRRAPLEYMAHSSLAHLRR